MIDVLRFHSPTHPLWISLKAHYVTCCVQVLTASELIPILIPLVITPGSMCIIKIDNFHPFLNFQPVALWLTLSWARWNCYVIPTSTWTSRSCIFFLSIFLDLPLLTFASTVFDFDSHIGVACRLFFSGRLLSWKNFFWTICIKWIQKKNARSHDEQNKTTKNGGNQRPSSTIRLKRTISMVPYAGTFYLWVDSSESTKKWSFGNVNLLTDWCGFLWPDLAICSVSNRKKSRCFVSMM